MLRGPTNQHPQLESPACATSLDESPGFRQLIHVFRRAGEVKSFNEDTQSRCRPDELPHFGHGPDFKCTTDASGMALAGGA